MNAARHGGSRRPFCRVQPAVELGLPSLGLSGGCGTAAKTRAEMGPAPLDAATFRNACSRIRPRSYGWTDPISQMGGAEPIRASLPCPRCGKVDASSVLRASRAQSECTGATGLAGGACTLLDPPPTNSDHFLQHGAYSSGNIAHTTLSTKFAPCSLTGICLHIPPLSNFAPALCFL